MINMQTENGEQQQEQPRRIISGGRLGDDGQFEDYENVTGRTPGDDGPEMNLSGDGSKEEGLPGEQGPREDPLPDPPKFSAAEYIARQCDDYTVEELFDTIALLKIRFTQKAADEITRQSEIVLENEQKLQRLQNLNYRLNNA